MSSLQETAGQMSFAAAPVAEQQQWLPAPNHWVACDRCQKWRRIDQQYAKTIDDNDEWYCDLNPDPRFASCSIPQELTNEEIDQEAAAEAAAEAELTPPPDAEQLHQQQLPKLPAVVQLISENFYSHRKRKQQDEDDIMVCHCPPPWRGGDGCGPNCINRMLCIECTEDFCPCENQCTNQMFSKKQYAKLSVRRAGPKGFGLYADEDLAAGQFVIQYVGEVLEEEEYLRRKQYYIQTGQRHYYFMNIGNGEVIDACRKGNTARFINHSCEPNCETQKWMVQGELAIGLFTLRKIKAGEELTFDYNFERYGDKPMRCFCGSKRCRKFIGGTQETTANIVELGDAEDVTNDPEPVLVREEETDVLVQAMLDKEIGTIQRNWDTKLLNKLQQLCRQKGIDWSYAPDEAGRTASTQQQAAVATSSTLFNEQSEEASHAEGPGRAAAAAASPASSSAPASGAFVKLGLDGAESPLVAPARAAKKKQPKRKRGQAAAEAAEEDPEAAAAAAAKKQQQEERKRQRLQQQQEKRQRMQEEFLRRQEEELLRIQRLREQQQQQQQQQPQQQQRKQAKKRSWQQIEDDEGVAGQEQDAAEAYAEQQQQELQDEEELEGEQPAEQQHEAQQLGEDITGKEQAATGQEQLRQHDPELEDEMSSDDMLQPGRVLDDDDDDDDEEQQEEEEDDERQQQQQQRQRLGGPNSRIKVVHSRRPSEAAKQPQKEAAPARRSFLTLSVSAPTKQLKKRSEVDRRLEQLVQKHSWKLKEPSKPTVVKVLRMFNLCDITPRQPDASLLLLQQQQQQSKPEPSPRHGELAEQQLSDATDSTLPGTKQPVGEHQQQSLLGSGGDAAAVAVDEEGLPQLPPHLQPLQALRGAELEARERESEARFRARQRARMADMGMLLDVVLASSSEKLKKEWLTCGILTCLQQALGRLPFTQEYSVVLVKVVRVLEHLPVTSDDLYTMRSAHGTFADLIRRMASSAADWEVRRRSHQLLKRYAAASCSDATLLQLYNLPGPNNKPYLLSLHLPPPQISRLMALLPKNAPPPRRRGRRRTPPYRGPGPGPGPGQRFNQPGPPPVGLPATEQPSSPSTSLGGPGSTAAAGTGPADGPASIAADSSGGWPPALQQQQQPWEQQGPGLPPPPWAGGGGPPPLPLAPQGFYRHGRGHGPPRHMAWSPGGPFGVPPRPGSGPPGSSGPGPLGPGVPDRPNVPGESGPGPQSGVAPCPHGQGAGGSSSSRGFAGPPGGRSPGPDGAFGRDVLPHDGPWGPSEWGDRPGPRGDWEAGGPPPGARFPGRYGGPGPLGPPYEGSGSMPYSFRERERQRELREREWEQDRDAAGDWEREREWEYRDVPEGSSRPGGHGEPSDAARGGGGWGPGDTPGEQWPPRSPQGMPSQHRQPAGGPHQKRFESNGPMSSSHSIPHSSSTLHVTDLNADEPESLPAGNSKGWRPYDSAQGPPAAGSQAKRSRRSGWEQLPGPPQLYQQRSEPRAGFNAATMSGSRLPAAADVEDLFVLGVYDSLAPLPSSNQEAPEFAWQAVDEALTGPGTSRSLSPIISGRFSPPVQGGHGAAAGRPSTPVLPPGQAPLAMEDVFAVRQDPVVAARTPGVPISVLLAGSPTPAAQQQQQHRPVGPDTGPPHHSSHGPRQLLQHLHRGQQLPQVQAQSQQQQQQQYPDSWDQPGPEFEAFVSDAVKRRLGKYVQPAHPNRITKEEAQQLFKKLRRQVVDKEVAASAERQAAGSFKPIERAKLEANIKEFVRLSIRRLHAARSGAASGPAGTPGPMSTPAGQHTGLNGVGTAGAYMAV